MKKTRKSFRFTQEQLDKIQSFMEYASTPEHEGNKKAISVSIRKAIKYLSKSFFDRRSFSNRGMFDRSLNELTFSTESILSDGNKFNILLKSYYSGTRPSYNINDLLSEIHTVLEINDRCLKNFEGSYEVGENDSKSLS